MFLFFVIFLQKKLTAILGEAKHGVFSTQCSTPFLESKSMLSTLMFLKELRHSEHMKNVLCCGKPSDVTRCLRKLHC